jgi:hypothetical protein
LRNNLKANKKYEEIKINGGVI